MNQRQWGKIVVVIILIAFVGYLVATRWGGQRTNIQSIFPAVSPNENSSLDFSSCIAGRLISSASTFYAEKIQILGANGYVCNVAVTRGTEGGDFSYSCSVPRSVGTILFPGAFYGPIASYCVDTSLPRP